METIAPVTRFTVAKGDLGVIMAATCAIAIISFCAVLPVIRPTSAYVAFYAGGVLLGPGMYSTASTVAVTDKIAPGIQTVDSPRRWLTRPPFFYLPFALLSRVDYRAGAVIWAVIGLAGFALFMAWWPSDRLHALWYAGLFLPLLNVFYAAQDTTLLLACVAGAAALHSKGWEFSGGALIGLCVAAKPSTFILVPFAVIALSSWRMAGGVAVAGAAAYLASAFIMADMLWPSTYLSYVLTVTPRSGGVPIWCIPIAGAMLAWWCKGRPSHVVYAVLLVGGLVLTPRALFYDFAILLPLALILHGVRRDAITVAVCAFPFVAMLDWYLSYWAGDRALAAAFLLGGMWVIGDAREQ